MSVGKRITFQRLQTLLVPMLFNFELYSQNEVGNIAILVFVEGSSIDSITLSVAKVVKCLNKPDFKISTMVLNQLF